MKTIIAGSRTITEYAVVAEAVEASGFRITRVVSGRAKGVDQLGELWADNHGIPWESFPADWNQYGPQAGYIRNVRMAIHAEALIAVWDGFSRGTQHMIDIARKRSLKVYAHRVYPQDQK